MYKTNTERTVANAV